MLKLSHHFFVSSPPRLCDRVAARVRARRLDVELAAGAPPEASPALALRARQLSALPRRRSVAASYRRLLHDAQEPQAWRPRVAACRGRVIAAADELKRLADALAQPGPVSAQGAAEALLLLRDGTGPLYNARATTSLRSSLAAATEDLRVGVTQPAPAAAHAPAGRARG